MTPHVAILSLNGKREKELPNDGFKILRHQSAAYLGTYVSCICQYLFRGERWGCEGKVRKECAASTFDTSQIHSERDGNRERAVLYLIKWPKKVVLTGMTWVRYFVGKRMRAEVRYNVCS